MLGAQTIRGRFVRPVAGLLFGLEGVLCDDTLWRRWLFRLLGQFGVRTDYQAFCRLWDSRCAAGAYCGERPLREAFRELLARYNLNWSQIDELELACDAQWRRLRQETRLMPGVKMTLLRLREQAVALGVLSDCELSGEELRRRLDGFGLEGAFASVLSSADVGQTKPQPLGYLRSVRAMGLAPKNVAFVGHDVEDLTGAARVELQTIAFNYDEHSRADVYLERFEQLLDLFDDRKRRAAAG